MQILQNANNHILAAFQFHHIKNAHNRSVSDREVKAAPNGFLDPRIIKEKANPSINLRQDHKLASIPNPHPRHLRQIPAHQPLHCPSFILPKTLNVPIFGPPLQLRPFLRQDLQRDRQGRVITGDLKEVVSNHIHGVVRNRGTAGGDTWQLLAVVLVQGGQLSV